MAGVRCSSSWSNLTFSTFSLPRIYCGYYTEAPIIISMNINTNCKRVGRLLHYYHYYFVVESTIRKEYSKFRAFYRAKKGFNLFFYIFEKKNAFSA